MNMNESESLLDLVEKRETADLAKKGRGQFLKGMGIATVTLVGLPVMMDREVHTRTCTAG